jgi:DNA-binding protein
MGRNTIPIPSKVMARILESCGAHRVSKEAADALRDLIMDKSKEICEQAIKIANHSGRTTVNDGDVRLAARKK